MFPGSTFIASRCVANLKSASPAEALRTRKGAFFSEEDWGCVSLDYMYSGLGLVACQGCLSDCFSLVGVRNISSPPSPPPPPSRAGPLEPGDFQSQTLWGLLLGLLPREKLLTWVPALGWGLGQDHVSASPAHLQMAFSPLLWTSCAASAQVCFQGNCFIPGCRFSV